MMSHHELLRIIGWMMIIAVLAALVLVMFIGVEDMPVVNIVPDETVPEKIQ